MSMLVTMEILRIIILLLPFCFYSIFCFPTRPLNERSTELAWQAWLLVDDQNQNKQYNPESFTRRRITPKSVFIAPTFSPESLPACADGYQPDSMGRCIKIIKLDEQAHLDFLLQKLNAKFGQYDDADEESQESIPTAGPFQLNIPLNGASEEDFKDDMDIAIVVAPTNGNFALDDVFKTATKRKSAAKDEEDMLKKLPESVPSINTNVNYEIESRFPELDQTTDLTSTISDETTTTTTSFAEVTTLRSTFIDEETLPTTLTVPTESTTLDIEEDTAISDQHALFFLQPSLINTKHVQNGTNNAEDTPNVTSRYSSIISNDDSLTTHSPNLSTPPIITTETNKHFLNLPSENVVRFPTQNEDLTYRINYVKFPEKVTDPNTYASRFRHGTNQQQFVFKNHQITERPFNHRNRDKNSHFWSVPPSWRESSPQKPIVLRFSRRSNSRHLYEEHLLPNTQNFETFYREVPSEDFSYIFGFDPNHSRRKNHR